MTLRLGTVLLDRIEQPQHDAGRFRIVFGDAAHGHPSNGRIPTVFTE